MKKYILGKKDDEMVEVYGKNHSVRSLKKAMRYKSEYDRKYRKQVLLRFHIVYDKPVLDNLNEQDNMVGYIRNLILKDIEETG